MNQEQQTTKGWEKQHKQMEKPLPQCSALDSDGKRCRKRSAIRHHYHGDRELYGYYGDMSVGWVEVNVCPNHAVAIGYKFSNPKKKQR